MPSSFKMRNFQRLYISTIFISLILSCRAEAICYYPDGITTEPNHSPCNSTLTDSACCDPLDSCTTSGLCLGRTGFNYRGSCADKTWTSPNCASGCHTDPFNKVAYNTFTPLWPCDKAGAPSTDYCCNSPGRNCCTIATFDYGTTAFAFKGGMDQMILELANLNSSSPVTVTVTATASATNAPTASSASSSSDTSSKSSSSPNLATTVGVAVGVPLGVLALGLLGFLFWRQVRQSRSQADQRIIEMNAGKPPGVAGYYAPSASSGRPVEAEGVTWNPQTSNVYFAGEDLKYGQRPPTGAPNGNSNPVGPHELI